MIKIEDLSAIHEHNFTNSDKNCFKYNFLYHVTKLYNYYLCKNNQEYRHLKTGLDQGCQKNLLKFKKIKVHFKVKGKISNV